jgi:hypothetical protein
MSEPVKLDLSVEKVEKAISLIVRIADSITKVIPGDVDDRIIDIFKQFADQPWFAELVVTLLGAFDPAKPVTKEEATKLAVAALASTLK